MRIKINNNYLWANIFFDQLAEYGVKYACISPGSRSTPLTYSLSQNKKIKSYVIVDERSSGFFALGIAKKIKSPVIVVTTSGTAAAELYPSIVEAYQSRVPLIICTADRPAYLRNSGANQTIDQEHLYNKNVRFFYDTGLPKIDLRNIKSLKAAAKNIFEICTTKDAGPVHINFPFEKPLEPNSFTNEIEKKVMLESLADEVEDRKPISTSDAALDNKLVANLLKKQVDGIITVGPGNFSNSFFDLIEKVSIKHSLPVFADASSGFRFKQNNLSNLISNYDALVRSQTFIKIFKSEFVLHFGRPLTSPKLEEYFSACKPKGFVINKFGDRLDPSRKFKIIKSDEELFLNSLLDTVKTEKNYFSSALKELKYLDSHIETIKTGIFSISKKINETGILFDVINAISPNSNLMIGNSVPIRDLDFFASAVNKNINVYQNRGVSGIDGVTSTALGICSQSKNPTYFITGDLSFYYDINSLLIAKQYNIPLITILINNNGGAIFRFLPVAEYKGVFNKYFLTPTDLSFNKLVDAFDIDFKELKTQQDILNHIKVSSVRKKPVIFEIKTNSEYSLSLRKKYWKKTNKLIENFSRNYEA